MTIFTLPLFSVLEHEEDGGVRELDAPWWLAAVRLMKPFLLRKQTRENKDVFCHFRIFYADVRPSADLESVT